MALALAITIATLVVAAALRSTWSPCGWSMLSTITPLSEAGRQHRFGTTAAWFVVGGALGGVGLGILGMLGALVVGAIELSLTTRAVVLAVVFAAAALLDAGVVRPSLPHLRRQVDEGWLDAFRPWVYGVGFGAQIGFGLATYIMTGAVYAVVGAGWLGGSPGWALVIGIAFGTLRGLAVLAGWNNRSGARLARFHQRFAAAELLVKRLVVAVVAIGAAVLVLVAAGCPGALALVMPAALVSGLVAAWIRLDRQLIVILPVALDSIDAKLERRETAPTTA